MNMDQKKRWFELFTLHGADALTPDEHAELQAILRRDAAARRLWFVHQDVEMGLRAHLAAAPVASAPLKSARKPAYWLQWRPLTAAAAGIVFGMLYTSVVFGFVTQRQLRIQTLLTEGFEDAEMIHDRGVPSRMEVWSGDLQAPQDAEGDVKPAEGRRMVTLPPVEKRDFSYAFRFVDVSALPPLSAGQTREIEVTAQFHGAMPGVHERFQIRLAAFADDVAGAREIWVRNHVDELALLHVAKTVRVPSSTAGWTTLRSTMDVPAGTRLLLVSLAAGVVDADAAKTAHYLDDVQIRLITHEAPLP